jgi:cytochrome c oxidase subunit 2
MVTSGRILNAGAALLAAGVALAATAAWAGTGQPSPGQMGLQGAVTPIAYELHTFYDLVNILIIAIAAFVGILMLIVIFRYNERANPTPDRFSHNTFLEVAWTVIPVVILVIIAIPSFKLLYSQYAYPKPDITIKAIGNAWFWEHEYQDPAGIKVASNIIRDEDLLKQELGGPEFQKRYGNLDGLALITKEHEDAAPLWEKNGLIRQLSVDNPIAVPVNKNVLMLVTSNDVIHSWTIPSFASKMQAVPGRLNATWFRPMEVGMYYGQCSVLCGKEHASMPIAVAVVSESAFNDWAAAAKAKDWERARTILRTATEKPGAKVAGVPSGTVN